MRLWILIVILLLIPITYASYTYKENGKVVYKADYKGVSMDKTIFMDKDGHPHFSIYTVYNNDDGISDAFNNSLIFQTDNVSNKDFMEICFWDKEHQLMFYCLNEGGLSKATTLRRSFQIVGNISEKEDDENFTLCEGYSYIDCATDITGADLGVADDIEAKGSIYTNENFISKNDFITVNGSNDCFMEDYTFVIDIRQGEDNDFDVDFQNFTLLVCDNSSIWTENINVE